jgi:hypothetical protein
MTELAYLAISVVSENILGVHVASGRCDGLNAYLRWEMTETDPALGTLCLFERNMRTVDNIQTFFFRFTASATGSAWRSVIQ